MSGRENLRVEANKILKTANLPTLSSEACAAVFDALVGMLKNGDRVMIQEFGTFYRKLQAPRVARNPKTGEQLLIPGKVKVGFCCTVPAFEVNEAEGKQIEKLTAANAKFSEQAAKPAKPAPAPKPAKAPKAAPATAPEAEKK